MKPNNLSELIPDPYNDTNVDSVVLLYRNNEVIPLPTLYAFEPGDYVFNYSKTNGFENIEKITPIQTIFTAEEWLDKQAYNSIRLLACLDFENKLKEANLTSPKLAATRQWINAITLEASINPDTKRNDWPEAPYTFSEISNEINSLLSSVF